MVNRWRALPAVLLATVGCLGDTGDDSGLVPAADPPDPEPALPELRIEGHACTEGGGHSVHPRSVAGAWDLAGAVPEPWTVADVLEDVGPQVVYSEVPDPMHPIPEEGHTWGNYHATVACREWVVNGEPRPGFVFGYVGAKVEEPPFGDGVPARNYLVTVVATNDDEVLAALHAAGIHATMATATLEADDTRLHTILDTEHHGTYESLFLLKELGAMFDEPVRLWWQHANENGTFTPVSLDMTHTTGGRHYGAQGQGYFSHTGTHMHGPQGGIWGTTAGVVYAGFDRVITLGPRPELVAQDAYVH